MLKNQILEKENERLKEECERLKKQQVEKCEDVTKEKDEECEKLRKEMSKIEEKNKSLEKECKNQREKAILNEGKSQEVKEMNAEIQYLRKQNSILRKDMERFVGSKKKLDVMLGSQRCFNKKAGIGHSGFYDDLDDKEKKVVKPF